MRQFGGRSNLAGTYILIPAPYLPPLRYLPDQQTSSVLITKFAKCSSADISHLISGMLRQMQGFLNDAFGINAKNLDVYRYSKDEMIVDSASY